MEPKVLNISVDFTKSVQYRPMRFVKGDSGSCKIAFNVVQDLTDLKVFVACSMTDDNPPYVLEANIKDNHTAELIMPSGTLSVVGKVDCQVALHDDTSRLTNAVGFYYTVEDDLSEAGVTADDRVPILTQLISDTENLLAQYDHLEQLAADTLAAKTAAQNSELTSGESETAALAYKNAAETAKTSAQIAETNAQSYKESAETFKNETFGYRNETETFKDNAQISASEADESATNAGVSENNAKNSELAAKTSEDNAKGSETVASQALADLLAMMGVDIATLVSGKIPMSQIPATATQEIHAITDSSELVSLVAQRGDLAEIVQDVDGIPTITKTYQLLGDGDATILSNWVIWGTSYAVQAGNATTATNAVDSTMINGHRVVTMTESQYEAAVLDEDTYYIVTPDV